MKKLKERLSLYPAPEEASNMVCWEVLEDCLVGSKAGGGEGGGVGGGEGRGLSVDGSEGQAAPAEPPTADMDAPHGASSALGLKGPGTQPAPRTSKGTSKGTPQGQPGSPGTQRAPVAPEKGAGASSDKTKTSDAHAPTLGTQPGSPGIKTPTLGKEATSPLQEPSVPWRSSGSCSVSDRYAETVEALRQIGQLSHPCASLKEQVAQLEASKSDHAELEKLRLLFSEGDKESITSILADLQGRVSSLQGLTSDLQGENGKIRQLEDAVGKLEVAGANWKGDVSEQITLQLGSTLQEMRGKLKELEEQQEMTNATLERLVAKTADELQEQWILRCLI
ncbi:uncharacterized protein LOC141932990 [Strix aluco]|uniref:uncharacterized protein LOC141932990 n=1 Tax=Strix aluco TaxID=111821 RepID=UPI003DA69CC4